MGELKAFWIVTKLLERRLKTRCTSGEEMSGLMELSVLLSLLGWEAEDSWLNDEGDTSPSLSFSPV